MKLMENVKTFWDKRMKPHMDPVATAITHRRLLGERFLNLFLERFNKGNNDAGILPYDRALKIMKELVNEDYEEKRSKNLKRRQNRKNIKTKKLSHGKPKEPTKVGKGNVPVRRLPKA